MRNLWNEIESKKFEKDPLELRAYSSRLLGQEPSLVLHGGGNTSVKLEQKNIFGEIEKLLCVKGSGWDLATIETAGFAPVRMETLLKLANLEVLSDSEMVRVQKSAMTNPNAPTPSVEAILHALIPFKFVDHTHADAVVAVTNSPNGAKLIQEILGPKVLYIPYVMPGFILARKVFEMTRDLNWKSYDAMVLLHHGVFTFSDDARQSYARMIEVVSKAEEYLNSKSALKTAKASPEQSGKEDLLQLAELRKLVSAKRGCPVVLKNNRTAEAVGFSQLTKVKSLAGRGPLTPDHVIHTKRVPLFIETAGTEKIFDSLNKYENSYKEYFAKNQSELIKRNVSGADKLKCLDPAPRWAVWKDHGVLSFGPSAKVAHVVGDIVRHTIQAEQWAENLGAWEALPEKDIFEVEYWELEQAKLKKNDSAPSLQGKVALVTGAATGIGKACVEALRAQGAAVLAVDINEQIKSNWKGVDVISLVTDLSQEKNVQEAVKECVRQFGGLDIVVANAGIFPASMTVESMDSELWLKTLNINLTSQMQLFKASAAYLKLGIDPTIIVLASKNVIAPGPGAAAYSVSKAGVTQLARVAALELGSAGVRVNILHPHAVMDTGIWTDEILESRAKHYKMSVDQYKKNNLMLVELRSQDVANMVAQMAGPLFSKITGAQITMDGGSDRTI